MSEFTALQLRVQHRKTVFFSLSLAAIAYVLPYLSKNLPIQYNLLTPLLWMFVFFIAYPHVKKGGMVSAVLSASIVAVALFLSIQIGSGMVLGYGLSPYDHSVLGLLMNLYRIIPMLIGFEALRALLVKSWGREKGGAPSTARFIGVIFLFTLLRFTPLQLSKGLIYGSSIKFMVSRFLPELARSTLLTSIVSITGFIPAAIFSIATGIFMVSSPILPALTWEYEGIIGIAAYLTVLAIYARMIYPFNPVFKKGGGELKTIAPLIVLSLAALSITGFFGFKPVVVTSSSMKPTINVGDIVVVKKGVQPVPGDIAEFYHEGSFVVHRVIDVDYRKEGKYYVTKGDAVKEKDPFETPSDYVIGRVSIIIPKLGWISIYSQSLLKTMLNILSPSFILSFNSSMLKIGRR